jgi:hypothetical protein
MWPVGLQELTNQQSHGNAPRLPGSLRADECRDRGWRDAWCVCVGRRHRSRYQGMNQPVN